MEVRQNGHRGIVSMQVNLKISQLVFHEIREGGDVVEYSRLTTVETTLSAVDL